MIPLQGQGIKTVSCLFCSFSRHGYIVQDSLLSRSDISPHVNSGFGPQVWVPPGADLGACPSHILHLNGPFRYSGAVMKVQVGSMRRRLVGVVDMLRRWAAAGAAQLHKKVYSGKVPVEQRGEMADAAQE